MTDSEIASLREELFVLKLVVAPCLASLATRFEDAGGYLAILEKQILDGIKQAAPSFVTFGHQKDFVRAAEGWLATIMEAARMQTSETPLLQ